MDLVNSKKFLISLFLALFVFPFSFGIIYGSAANSGVEDDEEETEKESTKMPSYLGISLGMGRSEILTNGHFIPQWANNLELISSEGQADQSIIKAKAVPFINRIYFQFVKKAEILVETTTEEEEEEEETIADDEEDTTDDDDDDDDDDEETSTDEYKLYEISIQFNEDYIGFYELLDLLSDGLHLPKFSIKMDGYGTPDIVEAEKVVWTTEEDSNGNRVKIILTRSNKINQFGNVVRFIHKKGFDYILDLNDPMTNPANLQDSFNNISATSPSIKPVIENQYIAKVGRKTYFLSALLPQINLLETETTDDEDDEEETTDDDDDEDDD
jgi:hypothetical protein